MERTEGQMRSEAKRQGYYVTKSRERTNVPNVENYGAYMLCDEDTGFPVLGFHFDAELNEIEDFLFEPEEQA